MRKKVPEQLSLWMVDCIVDLVEPVKRERTQRVWLFTLAGTREEAAEIIAGGIVAVPNFAGSGLTPPNLHPVHVDSLRGLVDAMRRLRRAGYRPVIPNHRLHPSDTEALFADIWKRND